MNGLALVFGCLGSMLLSSTIACCCARRWQLARPARIQVALGSAALVLVPVGDLMIFEYLRAVFGDLSMVTQALLAAFIVSYVTKRRLLDQRQLFAVMGTVLAGALLLYPAALGLMQFDPYALGYASTRFAVLLAGLTLAAWYLRFEWLAACLLLAVSGRLASALESRNVWDYLLDPLLALFAAYWMSRMALRRALPA